MDAKPEAGAVTHERPRIQILPPATVARIAAGEVLERPASAVKELVENSLDAGAARITVEVWKGGHGGLRVSDDGIGMTSDEIHLALQRHATSKLTSFDDLQRMRTLGFRGEALPSMAAVSELTIASCIPGVSEGVQVTVRGGELQDERPVAHPAGASISVRDLFFNQPVRRKFMRSPGVEAGHITEWIHRLAFARPEVSFRLIHDRREVLLTRGGSDLSDTAALLMGGEVARSLLPVNHRLQSAGLKVTGLAARPEVTRPTRGLQLTYVNGRFVRSPILQRAISDAYAGKIPAGRHPVLLLYLELEPGQVDVNVHPAKTEVRFLDDYAVASAVRQALSAALSPVEHVSEPVVPAPNSAALPPQTALPFAQAALSLPGAPARRHAARSSITLPDPAGRAPEPALGSPAPPLARLTPLAQIRRLFILAESEGIFYLIDQHVAHERVLYEELLGGASGNAARERLLLPVHIELPGDRIDLIMEAAPILLKCGYEIEKFGAAALLLRSVPRLAVLGDPEALFRDMVDTLLEESPAGVVRLSHQRVALAAAGKACKRAVKAGKTLSRLEQQQILSLLGHSQHPWTCPHGRPVFLEYSQAEISGLFGGAGCDPGEPAQSC